MGEARLPKDWKGTRAWSIEAKPQCMHRPRGFLWNSWHQYEKVCQRGQGENFYLTITKTGPKK